MLKVNYNPYLNGLESGQWTPNVYQVSRVLFYDPLESCPLEPEAPVCVPPVCGHVDVGGTDPHGRLVCSLQSSS